MVTKSKHATSPFCIHHRPHVLSGSQAEASDPLFLHSGKALGDISCGSPGKEQEGVGPFHCLEGHLVLEGNLMHLHKECGESSGHHSKKWPEEPERRKTSLVWNIQMVCPRREPPDLFGMVPSGTWEGVKRRRTQH